MMWTRGELKQNAKGVLRRTYWLSFALCLVAGLIAGVDGFYQTVCSIQLQFNLLFPINFLLIAGVFSLVYSFFISGPIQVGINRYFMTSREYDASFGKLFSVFHGTGYMKIVTTMMFRAMYTFFWTLLFLIPGLVKAYEYYFVPFILAENPDLPRKRVFEISRSMTQGRKWNIFLLDLSFMGWVILGMLACYVGVYFVTPYMYATYAELYTALRSEAIVNGSATKEELCGFYNDTV